MASINASTAGVGGVITTADNTGILNIQTAGTTAVTVNASQNVGIGTTTPGTKLNIVDANGNVMINATQISFNRNPDTGTIPDATKGTAIIIGNPTVSGATLGFWTSSGVNGSGLAERMSISAAGILSFNSGYGSVATAYGCRAWVNFNGTGTVAIRASGNVSSITDNGTGDYTVNFTTAMVDVNYATTYTAGGSGYLGGVNSSSAPTTSAVRLISVNTAAAADSTYSNVAIHR